MSAGARNRAGQFATPGALALDILRYCWNLWEARSRPVHFLEPCLGTGSFFSALLRVFPKALIERAAGFELDPAHADAARNLWHDTGLAVTQADFLAQPPPRQGYNLLVTNPPYVRHHHLGRGPKQRLRGLVRDRLGISVSGLAGLYCYFLLLADAWLEDGGLAVWLVPSEFMDVNYGSALKEYLTTRVRLLLAHRFCPSDVQFDDALVSSAVVAFEKAKPVSGPVVFSLGGSLREPDKSVGVPHGQLCPSDKWAGHTTARGPSTGRSGDGLLFGDLFTIRRGLATGNNRFFILPRARASALNLPRDFLRPILPPPRKLPQRVIETNSDGFPQLEHQLVLLDCRLPEIEVKERYPDLWRYLEAGRRNGIHRGYLTSRRTPWYAQEDRPPPPFLCTYMGRNGNGRKPFRFLWNKSCATAHNVYLLLYPRGILQEALEGNPGLFAVVFAALDSMDTRSITGDGRVYGGGLCKMEPRELGNVPADSLGEKLGLTWRPRTFRQRSLFDSSRSDE
jgi:hypothetical protein